MNDTVRKVIVCSLTERQAAPPKNAVISSVADTKQRRSRTLKRQIVTLNMWLADGRTLKRQIVPLNMWRMDSRARERDDMQLRAEAGHPGTRRRATAARRVLLPRPAQHLEDGPFGCVRFIGVSTIRA